MKAGKNAYLTEEDLWKLPPDDTAEALGTKLEYHWLKRKNAAQAQNKKPSLAGALFAAYGTPFMSAAVYKFLQDCLSFTQPQLLRRLLIFVGTYCKLTPLRLEPIIEIKITDPIFLF